MRLYQSKFSAQRKENKIRLALQYRPNLNTGELWRQIPLAIFLALETQFPSLQRLDQRFATVHGDKNEEGTSAKSTKLSKVM